MNFGCKVTKKIATKFTHTYNKLAKKGKINKTGRCRAARLPPRHRTHR